jgi:hypothetical protein
VLVGSPVILVQAQRQITAKTEKCCLFIHPLAKFSSISFTAMAYSDYIDKAHHIVNGINYSITTHPNAL